MAINIEAAPELTRGPAIEALRFIALELDFPSDPTPEELRGFLIDYGITQVIAWSLETHGQGDSRLVDDDEFAASLLDNPSSLSLDVRQPPFTLLMHHYGTGVEPQYGFTVHLNQDFSLDERFHLASSGTPAEQVLFIKGCTSKLADILEGKPTDELAAVLPFPQPRQIGELALATAAA